MKRKVTYTVLFVLTVLLLALPAVQQYTQWFKLKPLNGVTVATEQPKLDLKTFLSGEFQKQEDKYLTENLGFREWFIRCYNQMSWSLFRKWQNKSLFIDKDNWIFNDFTIKHFYGQSMYDFFKTEDEALKKMQNDARMLFLLQEMLKEYGVSFFVCLAPEKDMVCDSHVPEVKGFDRQPALLAIDYYPPVFDSLGIHYIDFSDYYMAIRDTVSYPLYLKSSSHWSNQAAVYAADTLFHYMERLSGINIPDLRIGEEYVDKAHNIDTDLEDVMNLLWPVETDQYHYNRLSLYPDSTAVRPKWLAVGDSYFKGFMYNINLDMLFKTHHYWYYNREIHDDPLHHHVDEVDLLRELLSSDIVMLIYSPSNLFDLNRFFLTRALFAFFLDDGEAEAKMEEIIQNIKNTPEWYASVEQSALQSGVEVELKLRENAQYMLYNSPGLYFDEFNATKLPASRNGRVAKVYAEINDPVREQYRQQILVNPEWFGLIKEKAAKAGLSVEEVMERDIDWMIQTKEQ
ncbi:MAG: hypothetical protein K6F96_03260 [Bacteroidales bacterium]|nr:hypothetical protein [Bacteroidales bacterium]